MNHFAPVKRYYSYPEYLQLTETLVAAGKTSGPEQTPTKIGYTKLNLQRMKRWDKTLVLTDRLTLLAKSVIPQTWWVFAEPWCGDGAQNLPVIQKIAEASEGNIEVRILLRDENLAVMDHYLTDGARSIPKLVALDLNGQELFTWGARPKPAQKLMQDWKASPGNKTADEIKLDLHLWYARDKGCQLQKELAEKMKAFTAVNLA